jgi:hypothetical protein
MPEHDEPGAIIVPDNVAEMVAAWTTRALRDVGPDVPAPLVEMATALYSWRNPDAALAKLIRDSALEDALAVRDDDRCRLLTFETSDASLIVEIEGSSLTGQIYPGGSYTVELHQPPRVRTTKSSSAGLFHFDDIAGGTTRIVVVAADQDFLVAGDWVIV